MGNNVPITYYYLKIEILIFLTRTTLVLGRHSTFPIKEKVTSFEDITSILIKVMSLRLCEDVSCSNGLFQSKLRSKSKKYSSCQSKKRRKNKREAARLKRLLIKRVKNKKIKKQLKKKCGRRWKRWLNFSYTGCLQKIVGSFKGLYYAAN